MSGITQILDSIGQGESSSAAQLLPLVYDELRKLAAARMAEERSDHTLQATALVHEAYMRLVDVEQQQRFSHRGHFFAAAAEAMRRILIDNARRKRSRRGGGDLRRQDVDTLEVSFQEPTDDVLALDDALKKLAAADETAAELVRLRFFAGLPIPEAAQILGISPRSADRLWSYARAWLHQEIHGRAPQS